jgi:uncharacterized protein DUF2786
VELNKVLSKVNGLIAKAEHSETPAEEAQACREAADRLMLKYAIDEATAEAARPAAQRSKPDKVTVVVGPYNEVIGQLAGLMSTIARHCRCQVRHYTSSGRDENDQYVYHSTVYGFQSDLRYFEILWTTVRLHMLGILRPAVNRNESVEANAYRLHEAGYNWLEIAQMYGWSKVTYGAWRLHTDGLISDEMLEKYNAKKAEIWRNKETGEYKTNWQIGSYFKRAYYNACKAKHEEPKRISAGGAVTYRKSAARGYHAMIEQRLRQMRRSQTGVGTSLDLRRNDLDEFYREDNNDLFTRCPHCGKLSTDPFTCEFCGGFIKDPPKEDKRRRASYKDMPFNGTAYAAGAEHARSADLMAGDRMGSSAAKSLS